MESSEQEPRTVRHEYGSSSAGDSIGQARRVIDELEDGVAVGFPDIMEKYRHAGEKIGVYPVSENSWMDMGQLEELENMRRRMEEQNG